MNCTAGRAAVNHIRAPMRDMPIQSLWEAARITQPLSSETSNLLVKGRRPKAYREKIEDGLLNGGLQDSLNAASSTCNGSNNRCTPKQRCVASCSQSPFWIRDCRTVAASLR